MRELEPTPEALEEIRAHLECAHGWTDFDPRRDVAFPDSTPAAARVAYLPATHFARARFICSDCHGGIYIQGQAAAGRPARNAAMLLPHPTLGIVLHQEVEDPHALALLVREWSGRRLGHAS